MKNLVGYLDAYPDINRNFSFCLIHIWWIGLKSYNQPTLVLTLMSPKLNLKKSNSKAKALNKDLTLTQKLWEKQIQPEVKVLKKIPTLCQSS